MFLRVLTGNINQILLRIHKSMRIKERFINLCQWDFLFHVLVPSLLTHISNGFLLFQSQNSWHMVGLCINNMLFPDFSKVIFDAGFGISVFPVCSMFPVIITKRTIKISREFCPHKHNQLTVFILRNIIFPKRCLCLQVSFYVKAFAIVFCSQHAASKWPIFINTIIWYGMKFPIPCSTAFLPIYRKYPCSIAKHNSLSDTSTYNSIRKRLWLWPGFSVIYAKRTI